MPTVQQMAAQLTRDSARSLARAVQGTPADKLTWAVLDKGRTVLELLQECAVISQWVANCLVHQRLMDMGGEEYGAAVAALSDVEQALYALERNADELAAVIEQFPDANLNDEIEMPWGTETFGSLLFGNYWNTTYHLGQVSFIQTLYGDTTMY